MPAITWLTGDVHDGLALIPDDTVDLVVTSPPFLALRSYLPADHPDKGKEIGSEATPAAFIDVMLAVTAELRRVAPRWRVGPVRRLRNNVDGRPRARPGQHRHRP